MNKIIYQDDSYDLNRAAGYMSQFIETDKLVKKAASEAFSKDLIAQYAPDKDHFMMHLIAMGGHPTYLPNRNGDAFPSSSIENYHDTFVKNGCFFREHLNRCQKTQGIGLVKASAYDKKTDRVELIIWGNKKKAEEEYELAKSGSELSFSMSCKLPNDECSICGNKAKKLSDYCSHLKDSMGQYIPEFRKYAFAYNREPNFFDISRVKRPADRIAHYLEYKFGEDELQKAASSDIIIPGAAWAEFEKVALDSITVSKYKSIIDSLATHEHLLNKYASTSDKSPIADYINKILPNVVLNEINSDELTKISKLNPGTLFYKLNKRASILPYYSFVSYVSGKSINELKEDTEVVEGKEQLPFGYNSLSKQGCCNDMEEMLEMFNPGDSLCEFADPASTDAIDEAMDKLTEKFSCRVEPVRKRVAITIIKSGSTNNRVFTQPEKQPELNKWASAYLAYQLNAMFNIANTKDICDTNEVSTDLAYAVALNRFS